MVDKRVNGPGLGLTVLRNRYFVMRHGESEANVLAVAVGDPERGVAGFGLTDLGRRQIVETAKAFKQAYSPCQRTTEILASDFRRTRETAELMARSVENAMPVTLRTGLRERSFGRLEGKHHSTLAALVEEKSMAEVITRYGCEPSESVQRRVISVVRDAEKNRHGKMLLLVSHADPIQALMAAFAGLEASEAERIEPLAYAELAELSLGMPLRFKAGRNT